MRGINTRTTPRRHTSRRNTCRSVYRARVSMSRGHSVSRRRSRSGWRGGRSSNEERVRTTQRDGEPGRQGMRKLLVMVAGSAMAVLGGCTMLGHAAFQNPLVNLHSVAIRGLGLTGGSLDVQLSVYNPNGYRLDATHLNYRVNLAGDSVTVASGALATRTTVQSKDSTIVTIPVNFTYSGVGAAGRALLNMGAVNYHVLGDVTVGSVVGNFTVPYSTTGRFTATGVAR